MEKDEQYKLCVILGGKCYLLFKSTKKTLSEQLMFIFYSTEKRQQNY